ncbi:MAG: acyl-CoA reductase-like NAD-dependent aldehyde dehydrogenase [Chlamydiales bacterium]|jgi:acyl-CoA reductase-like NAD-dependent aldehyde dehydrogenase
MKIVKTIKLFIGGKFVRSEREWTFLVNKHKSNEQYARLCQASRKDFRNAVTAARNGYQSWSSKTAFNRAQILYRCAEMTEGKREEFLALFKETLGLDQKKANAMVDKAVDTFVYYAGFCDKYQQVLGSVNPINGPYHNFTTPDAVGVVALIDSDKFCFGDLVDRICSVLVGGNSVVALLSSGCPAVIAPLAEVVATSDVPAGTVNLLCGKLDELYEVIGGHHEVRSVSYQNENEEFLHRIKELGVENLKRIVPPEDSEPSLKKISNFIEYKSVWHPIGH